MRKGSLVGLIAIALLAGGVLGYFLSLQFSENKENVSSGKKPLYWIDPMEPTIHYPGPGKSRMNMALVPVYPEQQGAQDNTVRISPTVINNLGVRTAPVEQGELPRRIESVGYVEPNENKIVHIHTYAEGWIKKLIVKAVGEQVSQGQLLLQFYSPMLINAQEEFLLSLGSGNKRLVEASIQKLKTLKVSESQIERIKKNRKVDQLVDIFSPQNGVITALNVREGMHVTPENEMMSIVDLSSIWIIAQILEQESGWVKKGQEAVAMLSAYPGKVWKGVVEYVYPEVDPTTRTLKVRFRFDNVDGVLKPNMYAEITLLASNKAKVLSIPGEALIRSSQGNRVIVALGKGRFQVRNVTIGIESGDRIEILSGLKLNEQVVVSGQFLIDSEANLKASTQRMEGSENNTKASSAIMAQGIVEDIDEAHRSIKLKIEPIAALDMPAMTKNFVVAEKISLTDIKTGDSIKFTLEEAKNNQLMITHIQRLSN